jgi:hypothetical protein
VTGLGIIAGGGELPLAIADEARENGKPVFIAALRGIADDEISRLPHEWVSLGQVGRMFSLFRQRGCDEVLLAGKLARPKWSEIKLDAVAMMKLPKLMAAAAKGDDSLLRSIVEILEGEGFRVVSAVEAAPSLMAGEGAFGKRQPSAEDKSDIGIAARVVQTLGELDVGQAAVVCDGLVLAVEAAEGTDAMLVRVASLPENIRGTPAKRRGVLVKARKPTQDGKTDLPVVGVATIRNAATAGLAGVAVEAGAALIVNRKAVIEAADKAGLFVFGFTPPNPG